MKTVTWAYVLLLSFSTSGCSLLVGPSAYSDVYSAKTSDIVSEGTDVWTDFSQLPLETARIRLNGASELFRKKSLSITRLRDGGGDVVAASLVAGAIAGSTGSVEGARIGTGLAGLLGIGVDRYKLDVQRANLVSAAEAFVCINDSFAGLVDSDLNLQFTDDDPAVADKLNLIRRDAKVLISRAAADVRFSFEDAQAKVALKQPDIAALQVSLKKQEQTKPPPASLSIFLNKASGQNFEGAVAPSIQTYSSQIKSSQKQIASLDAVISYLQSRPELKEQLAIAKKDRDELLKKIVEIKALVLQYVENEIGSPAVSDEHIKVVAGRLELLESKLAACRALISK